MEKNQIKFSSQIELTQEEYNMLNSFLLYTRFNKAYGLKDFLVPRDSREEMKNKEARKQTEVAMKTKWLNVAKKLQVQLATNTQLIK